MEDNKKAYFILIIGIFGILVVFISAFQRAYAFYTAFFTTNRISLVAGEPTSMFKSGKNLFNTFEILFNEAHNHSGWLFDIAWCQPGTTCDPDVGDYMGVNKYVVSTDDSSFPIYMYVGDNTVYYTSKASKLFLNPDSSGMFGWPCSVDEYEVPQDLNQIYLYGDPYMQYGSTCQDGMYQFDYDVGDYLPVVSRAYISSIDMSKMDGSLVTNMAYMFQGAGHITDLNISNLNVSNVTNMSRIFRNMQVLENLNMGGWDVSKLTDLSNAFVYTYALTNLNVNTWNTKNLRNLASTFEQSYIRNLNINNWNTSNVTNMSYMLPGVNPLNNLNLSSWDTSNVTNMSGLFMYLNINNSIGIQNFNTKKVTDMSHLFSRSNLDNNITNLCFLNISNVTNMSYILSYANANWLDLTCWNTSTVINLQGAFSSSKMNYLIVSDWNTKNVTAMSSIFSSTGINQIYADNLNFYKVNNLSFGGIFSGQLGANVNKIIYARNWNLSNINNVDMNTFGYWFGQGYFSNWDVGKVNNFTNLFRGGYNSSNIRTLDISNWNINRSSLIYNNTFLYQVNLTSLSMYNWNYGASNPSMNNLFNNLRSLEYINLGQSNMSKITYAANMFRNTTNLKYLDFSANLNAVSNVTNMFYGSMSNVVDTIYIKTPSMMKKGTYSGPYANIYSGPTISLPDTFVIELPEYYCLDGSSDCNYDEGDYPWVSTLTYYSPKDAWIRNRW